MIRWCDEAGSWCVEETCDECVHGERVVEGCEFVDELL
jgi:hypothetical protein